ncbi:glycosyltransferase family 4 protein [Nostoc sp. FACHB-110]|uniref:glycosyltransferase family 4 protein n=1 Tax=Nostoc sp. FACHB-110 TaxID=2692834 RepID=UPI00168719F5|nr:glycosyltransferase family 4 protein [Nostoc sp. FACHB-110]MBD2435976.1 glycosyltransferase family 4 protein [Nostoc sp. FACHB-110]
MKLLILHNRYQLAGGEDKVMEAEKNLLEANGHDVLLLEENNLRIANLWQKFVVSGEAIYSVAAKRRVQTEIYRFRPDIVHVHNFFPLLSPSVYDACYIAGVPVVQTLHNYRLGCPKAMPFRDSKICEDCIGKLIPFPSVVHGCYRHSRIQSLVVASMTTLHKFRGTWHQRVDAYIALTQFQKDKMIQAGLPAAKIYVKPNFVDSNSNLEINHQRQKYLLFVGRLSEEKGMITLINCYIHNQLSIPLKVVGDGPLRQELQQQVIQAGYENLIEFLGYQDKLVVNQLMIDAQLLIFPSIWYEGFPVTIIEAFAASLPVVVPKLGSMAEIVEDKVNGLHYAAGKYQDLAEKINLAINQPELLAAMGRNARLAYEKKYSPAVNYQELMAIYQRVIAAKNS